MLKRSSPSNCKTTFIIGRGFADCQILKKWKWPHLLNWVEYFDKLLRKHWYWQDLAQCELTFLSVEALPSSKFWKSENGPISCTEWNIVMKFCIHIGILTRCSPWDCQMTFGIGRGCVELQILKKWKWPNWVDYCDETLHTHWYWQDVAQEIVKCHLGLAEALPRFKFWKTVKLALSLETFWIFW